MKMKATVRDLYIRLLCKASKHIRVVSQEPLVIEGRYYFPLIDVFRTTYDLDKDRCKWQVVR